MIKNISTRTLFSLASMVHILLVKVKEMKTAYLTMKPCVKHGDGTFKHINDPSEVNISQTIYISSQIRENHLLHNQIRDAYRAATKTYEFSKKSNISATN